MRVQRSSCLGIVKKTVLQGVLDELSPRDWNTLDEMQSADKAISRVKNFISGRCTVHIMNIEADHMLNCSGREAHVVGGWAKAAIKETQRDLREKITEYRRKRGRTRSTPTSSNVPQQKGRGQARDGGPQSRSGSVQNNVRQSNGASTPGSRGIWKNAVSGRARTAPVAGGKRVRNFFADCNCNDDDENSSQDASGGFDDEDDDVSTGKQPQVGLSPGLKKLKPFRRLARPGRRGPEPLLARPSEVRTVQNGGVKKVRKSMTTPGIPTRFRPGESPGSSRASSSYEAVEDETPRSKAPVSKKAGASTPKTDTPEKGKAQKKAISDDGLERKDRTGDVINLVGIVHSQSALQGSAALVNLYKIAGHALVCNPNDRMRVTSMTDDQYRTWSQNFCEWAKEAVHAPETSADIFMGLRLHHTVRLIWDANWEDIGGNRLDANPRRPTELLAGLDEPLD